MKIEIPFFSHDLWFSWEQVGKLRLAFVTTQAHSLQMLPCPGPLALLGTGLLGHTGLVVVLGTLAVLTWSAPAGEA